MVKYDKDEIKSKLTEEHIFELLEEFGGRPSRAGPNIISDTICHNHPGEGSHKLYYYPNGAEGSGLFKCYTDCEEYFDIFELIAKINRNEYGNENWQLYDSVKWVAARFGWGPTYLNDEKAELVDSTIFDRYSKNKQRQQEEDKEPPILQQYNPIILKRLSYPIIEDWEKEGIKREVLSRNLIGYYPTTEQITIPHFDINGRFIGLRGRVLGDNDESLGKYRPIVIGKQMYNHPLGLNLYNIQNSKQNIKKGGVAIVGEGEKFALMFQSFYGQDNDISVACCGSSISSYQIELLKMAGAKRIYVAFDRQFKYKDDEYRRWMIKLNNLQERFGKYIELKFIVDVDNLLPYKASPIDEGKEVFEKMLKNDIGTFVNGVFTRK